MKTGDHVRYRRPGSHNKGKVHFLKTKETRWTIFAQCDRGLWDVVVPNRPPSLFARFHPTTDPVTCKKCLRKMEGT